MTLKNFATWVFKAFRLAKYSFLLAFVGASAFLGVALTWLKTVRQHIYEVQVKTVHFMVPILVQLLLIRIATSTKEGKSEHKVHNKTNVWKELVSNKSLCEKEVCHTMRLNQFHLFRRRKSQGCKN